MNKILRYLVNLLLGLDQLINTLLLGHPDETLSSRLGRTVGKERYFWISAFRNGVDLLFFFDKGHKNGKEIGHCENSILPLEQMNFRDFDYELWSWTKKENR